MGVHRLPKDPKRLDPIDIMVDEKMAELDAIYNRFHGPDATETDPITIALNNYKGEKHIMENTYCFVDLGNKRRLGRIVKANKHTVWVKIMIGARNSFYVQRHRIKHNIGGYYCEIIYP